MPQIICSIDECERPVLVKSRGWCRMHYLRWRKTGDLGPAQSLKLKNGSECAVDGCVGQPRKRGMCDMHYRRRRIHGDPGQAAKLCQRNPSECTMDDCTRPPKAHGLCGMHYVRQWKHGDPNRVDQTSGNFRGDNIGYSGIHMRVRSLRGPATQHHCRHCGDGAEQWAYDHGDSNERRDDEGRLYSTETSHYMPLCVPCHRELDGLP